MPPSKSIFKASDAIAFPVDADQTLKASRALLAHIKTASATAQTASGKENLLGDTEDALAETPIWLTMTTKQYIHSSHRLKPGKMILPHPLRGSRSSGNEGGVVDETGDGGDEAEEDTTTICLITADPQRAYKDMVASDPFPEDLRRRITRVVDLTHLRAKFRPFENQRRLRAEHDVFLADDRVVHMLPKTLGKTFFRGTTKRPIPVALMPQRARGADGKTIATRGKDDLHPLGGKAKRKRDTTGKGAAAANMRPAAEIATEIRKALGAAVVNLSPSNSIAVVIGFAGWPAARVAANVTEAARQLAERWVPHGWANVRAVYVKGPATAALPIWQTDELWLDGEKDVVADEQAAPRALVGVDKSNKGVAAKEAAIKRKRKAEKANIGKKRKTVGEATERHEDDAEEEEAADAAEEEEEEEEEEERPQKRAKKMSVPKSNDDRLDREIAERKARLQEQKQKQKQSKKRATEGGNEAEDVSEDEGLAAEEAFIAKRRAKAAKQGQKETSDKAKKPKTATNKALEQHDEDKKAIAKEVADRKAKLRKQKSAAKKKLLEA